MTVNLAKYTKGKYEGRSWYYVDEGIRVGQCIRFGRRRRARGTMVLVGKEPYIRKDGKVVDILHWEFVTGLKKGQRCTTTHRFHRVHWIKENEDV